MKIFGFEITRRKASDLITRWPVELQGGGGWVSVIRESFAGAWQRGVTVTNENALSFHAVFACVTLIAADIGKLWLDLTEEEEGVWLPTESPAFSPVLREPNHYQTRQQFFEHWITSKLIHGNAYILKGRDARGLVTSLHVLHPLNVTVLLAPDSSVFYQLSVDQLSGIEREVTFPEDEIIHDRMNCLYHPLHGLSPISACGVAAGQGLKIIEQSAALFANGSYPGGILLAPTSITNENRLRIETDWANNYGGVANAGKVPLLEGGMTYQPLGRVTAHDAQLIDQLKLSGEMVCNTFHVPAYMVGAAPAPSYNNVQVLYQQYYSQCLQSLIEAIENLLDKGLRLPRGLGVRFDLDALLRMDTATATKSATEAIMGGLLKPNEARKKFDLPPVDGGDTVYLQQQQYSLAALNKRDTREPAPPTGEAPAAESLPVLVPAAKEAEWDEMASFTEAFERTWDAAA